MIPEPIAGLTIGNGAITNDPRCCFCFSSEPALVVSDLFSGLVSGAGAGADWWTASVGTDSSIGGGWSVSGASCAAIGFTTEEQNMPAKPQHKRTKTRN